MVASVLNEVHHPHDLLARCVRGWSVTGVALRFFTQARHLGGAGLLQTWGGHAFLWGLVVAGSVHEQSMQMLRGWLYLQGTFLVFFAGWFTLLALLGLDSQFGRIGGGCHATEANGTGAEESPTGTLHQALRWQPPVRIDSFGDLVSVASDDITSEAGDVDDGDRVR